MRVDLKGFVEKVRVQAVFELSQEHFAADDEADATYINTMSNVELLELIERSLTP